MVSMSDQLQESSTNRPDASRAFRCMQERETDSQKESEGGRWLSKVRSEMKHVIAN